MESKNIKCSETWNGEQQHKFARKKGVQKSFKYNLDQVKKK
jgi:hypothetical protein